MSSAQLSTGSARHRRIEVEGLRIASLQAGDEHGDPVLLVPGYTGSKEDFGPVLQPIAAAGYRVVAIDLPGQYQSPGRPDSAQYTPDALGRVVLAIARTSRRPVHLLGHSFGGLVARAAVIADAAAFASLVLMDSGPSALHGPRREMIEQLEPVLASGGLPLVYSAMQAAQARRPGYVTPPPPLAAFLKRRFLAGEPAMLQGMGTAVRIEPDRVGELLRAMEAAGLRSLVLYGRDEDAWPPPIQVEMARRLSSATVVIDGAAHSPAVENPTATAAALIEFWSAAG